MATYYARASGSINGAIWATTPTGTAATATFTSSDVLCANGISTITINVATTVAQIRNDAFSDGSNTATAGGAFALTPGVTLTANLICQSANLINVSSPGTYTVIGSLTSNGGAYCIFQTAGTLNITGALLHTTGTYGGAVWTSSTGPAGLNITGNVTGGASGNIGGGLHLTANCPVTITGDVTAGSNGPGVLADGHTGTITITGTVSGSGGAQPGMNVRGLGGTVTINGTCVGGTNSPGMSIASSGTYIVTRAKASSTQPGVVASIYGVRVTEIEYADNGFSPATGIVLFAASTGALAIVQVAGGSSAGSKKTLVDPISTGYYPATGDVRSGTSYAAGARAGTLAVPAASLVASGVAVDATTGTAAITSAAIQSACASALTGFASGRLADVSTTATTGQQIADATF